VDQIALLSEQQIEQIIERTATRVADNLRADLERSRLKEILSKQDLAEYWNCSVATINRWMLLGLPHDRVDNGHPSFRRSKVDFWRERFQTIQGQEANVQV
jgi:hypothetical protein